MSDGSNLGITAQRALDTILGGNDQPTEEEKATPEQVRARIAQAPDPCTGPPIFDAYGDQGYAIATDALAKAFLIADTEQPGILETETFWPDNAGYGLAGKPRDACDAVWDFCMDRWPRLDDWLGGCSGFMVGFAYNTARYCLSQPPAPNPAILEIG